MSPLSRPKAVVSLAALTLVVVALLHGCNTGSSLDNRRFPCAQDDECVAGYLCREGECRPEGEPVDEPDGGKPDGGGGGTDGGRPDSGVPDSGVPDSGMPDSGVPDAGQVVRPTQLAFVTAPQGLDVGVCSPTPVDIETQSADGTAASVASTTTVSLKARNNDLTFYTNNRCQTARTQVTVAGGTSRASFYFRGSTLGVSPIDISAAGLASASQNEVIRNGAPAAVAFVSTAQTVQAGACSAAVVLEVRNASGGTTAFATATAAGITLSPQGGPSLYSDAACTTAITDATFAAGANQATFYFKGSTGGTFTLAAQPAALPQVSQAVTILPVVRTGTCTLADGTSSVTCPITPAQRDVAKTMLFFQATSDSADPFTSNVRCVLTSTSTVTCSRAGTVGVATVGWQTAELASGLKVQHLDATCPAQATATIDVPMQPVANLANTFLLVSSQIDGTTQGTDDFFTATLGATDHVDVQFGVPCTATWRGSVQVVEFTGASVTRGVTGAMAATSTQLTVSNLPAAPLASTALLFTYRVASASQPGLCDRVLRGALTSSTSITFTRSDQDTGCEDATIEAISWERINVGVRGQVQHLDAEVADTVHVAQISLSTPVDPTRTLVFASSQALSGQGGGETDFLTDDILGAVIARHTLLSPTRVEVRRDFTGDADTRWFSTVLQLVP
jgi:hypothetical protein